MQQGAGRAASTCCGSPGWQALRELRAESILRLVPPFLVAASSFSLKEEEQTAPVRGVFSLHREPNLPWLLPVLSDGGETGRGTQGGRSHQLRWPFNPRLPLAACARSQQVTKPEALTHTGRWETAFKPCAVSFANQSPSPRPHIRETSHRGLIVETLYGVPTTQARCVYGSPE